MRETWVNKEKVFAIRSNFDQPVTGGEIYNSKVIRHLQEHGHVDVTAWTYPWKSFLHNLRFDFDCAIQLLRATGKTKLIFDESMHQRMPITLLTAILLPKSKLILMLHQLAFTRRTNPLHRSITRRADGFMLKRCSLAISAGVHVTETCKKITHERYHCKIKNCLTTTQGKVDFSYPKKEYHLLFAGSIVRAKGLDLLVAAINLLPEELRKKLTIRLAGSHSDRLFYEQIKEKISRHGLAGQFEFLGLLNFEQLSQYYRSSELFVFPSLSENMPMGMLEAMSAGCIPVVFRNTAMPYFVKDAFNGYLVENRNINEFAKALVGYYRLESGEKKSLAVNASESVQEFIRSWDDLCQEYTSLVLSA